MKRKFSKFIALFLGLFGISTTGCFLPAPSYGVPSASYKLSGKVVDKDTTQIIENIELNFYDTKVYSDSNGEWQINVNDYSPCDSNCIIVVKDIDGEENGGQFTEKNVNIQPIKTEEGEDFYIGTFEQHDITIEMEKSPIPSDNND